MSPTTASERRVGIFPELDRIEYLFYHRIVSLTFNESAQALSPFFTFHLLNNAFFRLFTDSTGKATVFDCLPTAFNRLKLYLHGH